MEAISKHEMLYKLYQFGCTVEPSVQNNKITLQWKQGNITMLSYHDFLIKLQNAFNKHNVGIEEVYGRALPIINLFHPYFRT